MNDFEKMNNKIGNRFDLVLVASERMREHQRERRMQEELIKLDNKMNPSNEKTIIKSKITLHEKTFNEIEEGIIDRKILQRIKGRFVKSKKM